MDKFMHKPELEAELAGKGEYVQIDVLNNFLRLMPPHEMRRFSYIRLADIYMRLLMFKDASQAYQNIAVNSITFRDKIKYYVLCTKALIEGGFFEDGERALKRALTDANIKQKADVMREVKEFYKELGDDMMIKDKRNKASIYYEKYLRQDITDSEKEEIKGKLMKIYESLGKISEIKLLEGF